ncbi:uncharacterized protein [Littorina saxatilis]|uniref:uncharacterized protein isoform X2 n=1 Tax=Littorina saxatilis TaxID=31220 RepID=UPI0038B67853
MADGRYLYRLEGLTSSSRYTQNAVRLPGNNVFLCSLECRQVLFVLLQGTMCACSGTSPEILPVSGKIFRCPGTFDDNCGTVSTYAVYRNLLAGVVEWSNLVEKSRYHGTKAFLCRHPPLTSNRPAVQLMAEVDSTSKKGYICNGTVFNVGTSHIQHLWAEHPETSRLTWRQAQEACMNKGRELMTLSRDSKDCVAEAEKEMKEGRSYWVGLTRQNKVRWLDGTAVQTAVGYHHHGQSACLTMSMNGSSPTFTFESCTSNRLQVLCEKDTEIHRQTFTHDTEGNHIITRQATNENDYSGTVSILIGVLVVLCLLSAVLVAFLCNRKKWLPQKSPTKRESQAPDGSPTDTRNPGPEGFQTSTLRRVPETPEDSCSRDALGYATVNKGKQTRPPTTGSEKPSINSGSVEYTEVGFSDDSADDSQPHRAIPVSDAPLTLMPTPSRRTTLPRDGTALTANARERGFSSVKILDPRLDSSQSSVTGSDDAYSVLGYRKSIEKAWTGLKQTSYSHVMVNNPKTRLSRSGNPVQADDDYDFASHGQTARVRCLDNDYDHTKAETDDADYDLMNHSVSTRVPCIDNDYDHTKPVAEPRVRRSRSNPHTTRILLALPKKSNESEV